MDLAKYFQVGVTLQYLSVGPLSQRERGLTEVSCVIHRPEKPSRLWIQRHSFRSAYFCNIPQLAPSPSGRGLG